MISYSKSFQFLQRSFCKELTEAGRICKSFPSSSGGGWIVERVELSFSQLILPELQLDLPQ